MPKRHSSERTAQRALEPKNKAELTLLAHLKLANRPKPKRSLRCSQHPSFLEQTNNAQHQIHRKNNGVDNDV